MERERAQPRGLSGQGRRKRQERVLRADGAGLPGAEGSVGGHGVSALIVVGLRVEGWGSCRCEMAGDEGREREGGRADFQADGSPDAFSGHGPPSTRADPVVSGACTKEG